MTKTTYFVVGLGLLAGALALPGCNTIKGMGKDVHDIAQNTQSFIEQSDQNREYLPMHDDMRSSRARP